MSIVTARCLPQALKHADLRHQSILDLTAALMFAEHE
jgi:hypothetical protein